METWMTYSEKWAAIHTRILDSPRLRGESSKTEDLRDDGRHSQATVIWRIWVGWKNNRSKEKPDSFSLLSCANVILENKDKPFVVGFSSYFRRKRPQVRAGSSFFFCKDLHWMFFFFVKWVAMHTHFPWYTVCRGPSSLLLASRNILYKTG